MRNKHGVWIPAFYGDITVSSYPNPRVFGPTGGNRSQILSVGNEERIRTEGLKFPGGRIQAYQGVQRDQRKS